MGFAKKMLLGSGVLVMVLFQIHYISIFYSLLSTSLNSFFPFYTNLYLFLIKQIVAPGFGYYDPHDCVQHKQHGRRC